MSNTTKTTFDQSSVQDFEFAHGRKPRGTGSWAFSMHGNGSSTTQFFGGSFTDAKKEAVRVARSLGCDCVRVES